MEFPLPYLNPLSIILLFIISSCYLSRKWVKRGVCEPKKAPSPPGAWPIIGHLHLLNNGKLPHHVLGAMADKYGPIFHLQLGSRPALVVSNWEMAKESMCINDGAAASRPELSVSRNFSYHFAMFGLASYSSYWRDMRKITHLHLLSNPCVDQVKSMMLSEMATSVTELHARWASEKNQLGHIKVEMKRWFGDVTLNMLLKVIIGKRCVGPNAKGDEKEAIDLQMAIRKSFHLMGEGMLRDYIPILANLGFDRHGKAMEKIAIRIDSILQSWLQEHRRNTDKNQSLDTKDGDFMDSLLSLCRSNELPSHFDHDTIVKATTLNMIAGGTESSSVTLTWALSLLVNNPRALEKAYEELDQVVGRDRRVKESDITKLVYLQAVVKETMRLYPAGPLLGPREFYKDCFVAGYFVPKGTQLIPNIWKIQTDPRVWPDPFEFKPERFLTTHCDVDLKGNNFELIPFGSGRRGCPAVAFGLQMVHFALAGFLHSFTVKTPTPQPVDMAENFGMANEKVVPLDVLVTPRLPSHLHGPIM
ncbi:cytochrome P450 CYP82D47-like [Cucurbita pepo subsp. pepo]|uniref:cytochrome P450 CYP82D47-like n=1 Tax=Cucurbita pepo subsp. pepo TaxID=3664 RepID=UPI000C9D3E5A|nr:cytochrome P450 CYP82D47-like [Cucurbita pepo subsp. pepo]